jgi:hypothetical protein
LSKNNLEPRESILGKDCHQPESELKILIKLSIKQVPQIHTPLKRHPSWLVETSNIRSLLVHQVGTLWRISKMWESWFGLAKPTMFGSDDQAKYDHVILTTLYRLSQA